MVLADRCKLILECMDEWALLDQSRQMIEQ